MLDAGNYDEDVDGEAAGAGLFDEDNGEEEKAGRILKQRTATDFENQAADVYESYSTQFKRRFKWLRPDLFVKTLSKDLSDDASSLLSILTRCGEWRPEKDTKTRRAARASHEAASEGKRSSSSRSSLTPCGTWRSSSGFVEWSGWRV